MKQFLFTGSIFNTSSVVSSPETSKPQGGAVAVSAWTYGGSSPIAGTGIVWANRATSDVGGGIGSGELHAYEGGNVANELWNSLQNASRDDLGNQSKFVPPTVANGKVYVPSNGPVDAGVPDGQAENGQLNVYGLLQ